MNHPQLFTPTGPTPLADLQNTIRQNHYTQSVPAGKSHYVQFEDAIVVWSIPANPNIAKFLLGRHCNCWELSRLWAPDGHRNELLTQAIAHAVTQIRQLEQPEILVSYADPNAGHHGGVYRAASWTPLGQCDESRMWIAPNGATIARRAFHSGHTSLRKIEIEQMGYRQVTAPGKLRFARPLTRRARRELATRWQQP